VQQEAHESGRGTKSDAIKATTRRPGSAGHEPDATHWRIGNSAVILLLRCYFRPAERTVAMLLFLNVQLVALGLSVLGAVCYLFPGALRRSRKRDSEAEFWGKLCLRYARQSPFARCARSSPCHLLHIVFLRSGSLFSILIPICLAFVSHGNKRPSHIEYKLLKVRLDAGVHACTTIWCWTRYQQTARSRHACDLPRRCRTRARCYTLVRRRSWCGCVFVRVCGGL
jgi:hypothetical protein